jgi:hypothetical protein
MCLRTSPWEKEHGMRYDRQLWSWMGVVLSIIVVLTGCAYDVRGRHLSPAEQAEFEIYRKVMTPAQRHTYLTRATAAERTTYLQESGLVQRFQALDPRDREAVQRGVPRAGMSAEALRFVWGEPYRVEGDARRSAHWHYLGSLHALSAYGNQFYDPSKGVDVYLAHGKVVAWAETVPPLCAPAINSRSHR